MVFSRILAGAALALLAVPASATFTLNNSLGGDGFVTVNSPTSFTIFGDNSSTDGNITSYGTVATLVATITGTWSYSTADVDGSLYDPAGYFVNNVFTQLSSNNLSNPALHGGGFSFTVNPGDTYGFYVSTVDGDFGRGSLVVALDSLAGTVPEPQAWALLIAGFGLVGAAARRRRSVAA